MRVINQLACNFFIDYHSIVAIARIDYKNLYELSYAGRTNIL